MADKKKIRFITSGECPDGGGAFCSEQTRWVSSKVADDLISRGVAVKAVTPKEKREVKDHAK